jgi:transposase
VRGHAATDDRLNDRAGASTRCRGGTKKRGGGAQAIGRSRGGLSTKVVAVASDEDGVIAVDIDEGQRHDARLAEPILTEAKAAIGVIDEVLGDKAFDSDAIRGIILDDLDALPVIPNKTNRKEPWPWDEEMAEAYKQRNRIERLFGKAKQFRRFATRYDKLRDVYLGLVRLVLGFINVKRLAKTVNTP